MSEWVLNGTLIVLVILQVGIIVKLLRRTGDPDVKALKSEMRLHVDDKLGPVNEKLDRLHRRIGEAGSALDVERLMRRVEALEKHLWPRAGAP